MPVACDLVHQQGTQQNQYNAHKVHERTNPGGVRKECTGKQGNHRQLCAAGHKWGQHGSGPAFPFIADGAAGHHAGNGAAGAHHKWNHGLAGKTHLFENGVQHHRGPGHVAAVLQQGNEEIHDHDQRKKANHSDDAAKDAIHQQCL